MGKFLKIVLLSFLPALIALGHDCYLYKQHVFGDQGGFVMADLGFVWNYYSSTTLGQVRDVIPQGVWDGFFAPVLESPAAVVFSVPAGIISFITLVMYIFGWGAFEDKGVMAQFANWRQVRFGEKEARMRMKNTMQTRGSQKHSSQAYRPPPKSKKGKNDPPPPPPKDSNEVGLDDAPVQKSDKW